MDHVKTKQRPVNPEETTNFLLKFLFIHMRNIFRRRVKNEADIYEVLPSFKSKMLGDKLETNWNKQRLLNDPSMFKILRRCFGKEYLLLAITQVIPITITIVRPKIVRNFISYFTNNHNNFNKNQAWFLGGAFVIIEFIDRLYRDNFALKLEALGVKMRTGLTSMIYKKVLKMNLSQLDNISVGKIITIITRDVNEFDIYVFYTTYLWCDFLRFLVRCYVVYVEIGPLVAILVGLFCVIISIQVALAKILASMKVKTLKRTDLRYQATKEMLDAITTIKYYIWGDSYRKKVSKVRR
ncbi:unnamed protein product [Tenebrio molitor]|nr:unnamed protein product [Tenebrio molitor]